MKTRLEQSYILPEQTKYPVILPAASRLTELIVLDIHSEHSHQGPEATKRVVRNSYWPLGGKRNIRRILANCKNKECVSRELAGIQEEMALSLLRELQQRLGDSLVLMELAHLPWNYVQSATIKRIVKTVIKNSQRKFKANLLTVPQKGICTHFCRLCVKISAFGATSRPYNWAMHYGISKNDCIWYFKVLLFD